jgi:hypothetical protein
MTELRTKRWESLLGKLGSRQAACLLLYDTFKAKIDSARGSAHKHQAWEGGYIDHVCETVEIAEKSYTALSLIRPLPFSLESALVVLFIHDLEKPFKYHIIQTGSGSWDVSVRPEFKPHAVVSIKQFVLSLALAFGISLSEDEKQSYLRIEGEGKDYGEERVQTPLGAFCHCCDTISARIWPDQPDYNAWCDSRGKQLGT